MKKKQQNIAEGPKSTLASPPAKKHLYKKPCMLTFTGKVINPLELTVDDICIEDIAHALSNMCRYNGHVSKFYSVAEHCIIMAATDEFPGWAPWKLLHDASEAYIPDVCAGFKDYLKDFEEIENRILKVIAEKFGLPELEGDMLAEVKIGDKEMIYWEAKELMPAHPVWTDIQTEQLRAKKVEILKLTPWQAEELYLKAFYHMYRPVEEGEDAVA